MQLFDCLALAPAWAQRLCLSNKTRFSCGFVEDIIPDIGSIRRGVDCSFVRNEAILLRGQQHILTVQGHGDLCGMWIVHTVKPNLI